MQLSNELFHVDNFEERFNISMNCKRWYSVTVFKYMSSLCDNFSTKGYFFNDESGGKMGFTS